MRSPVTIFPVHSAVDIAIINRPGRRCHGRLRTTARRRGPFREGRGLSARETGWRVEQCRYLYSGMPGAIMVSGTIALILAVAQSSVVAPGRLIAWLAALGLVSLGRLALWRMNRKATAAEEQSALWLRRYRLGVLAAGLA